MFRTLTLEAKLAREYHRQLEREAQIERELKVDGLRTMSVWLWLVAVVSHLVLSRAA